MQLTNEQLWSIPINTAAMELILEALAREHSVLPVAVENGVLRLVLPENAGPRFKEIEEQLQFVLNGRFEYDTADPEELARVVDIHYMAVSSSVQNCDRAFQFQCPQKWAALQATEAAAVRWCNICQRTVTFCRTDEELDRLSRAGECVAFIDNPMCEWTLGALYPVDEE